MVRPCDANVCSAVHVSAWNPKRWFHNEFYRGKMTSGGKNSANKTLIISHAPTVTAESWRFAFLNFLLLVPLSERHTWKAHLVQQGNGLMKRPPGLLSTDSAPAVHLHRLPFGLKLWAPLDWNATQAIALSHVNKLYKMDKINADGTVLNFAQRHSNTQPACWLKTSTAMCCMAAPCHLREAENSPRHHLHFRSMWKNLLSVRSTSSFRHVDKSERMQSLEKVYAFRKDSMSRWIKSMPMELCWTSHSDIQTHNRLAG